MSNTNNNIKEIQLPNSNRPWAVAEWNGRRWVLTNKRNAEKYTIVNANRKNGKHQLKIRPEYAFHTYSKMWPGAFRRSNSRSITSLKNALINHLRTAPSKRFYAPLYRGVPPKYVNRLLTEGYIRNNSFISFSKNRKEASKFGGVRSGLLKLTANKNDPLIVRAIVNKNNGFVSNIPNEMEVLLGPGTLKLVAVNNANKTYWVRYVPSYM